MERSNINIYDAITVITLLQPKLPSQIGPFSVKPSYEKWATNETKAKITRYNVIKANLHLDLSLCSWNFADDSCNLDPPFLKNFWQLKTRGFKPAVSVRERKAALWPRSRWYLQYSARIRDDLLINCGFFTYQHNLMIVIWSFHEVFSGVVNVPVDVVFSRFINLPWTVLSLFTTLTSSRNVIIILKTWRKLNN